MRELYNKICGNCKSSRILFDEFKGEIFCLDCGLIFHEKYKIFSIVEYELKMKLQEDHQRQFLMKMLNDEYNYDN